MNYTTESGFLYSSRIITDSIQETRFLCATHTWNMLYIGLKTQLFLTNSLSKLAQAGGELI